MRFEDSGLMSLPEKMYDRGRDCGEIFHHLANKILPSHYLAMCVVSILDKPLICIVVHSRGCKVLFSKIWLSIIVPVLDIKAYKHHYVQKKDKNTIVRIVHGDAYIMKSSTNGRPRSIC